MFCLCGVNHKDTLFFSDLFNFLSFVRFTFLQFNDLNIHKNAHKEIIIVTIIKKKNPDKKVHSAP